MSDIELNEHELRVLIKWYFEYWQSRLDEIDIESADLFNKITLELSK